LQIPDDQGIAVNRLKDNHCDSNLPMELSVYCWAIPKRGADLKRAEFFDVKRYPVMKFKSLRSA